MLKPFQCSALGVLLLLAAALPLPCRAQGAGGGSPPVDTMTTTGDSGKLERKTKGWLFGRPSLKTPEAQLAYADRLRAAKRLRAATSAYLALVREWHGSKEAPAAQLAYAELLEERGDSTKAFDEYQYLVEFFPGLFPFDKVQDRQFRIANKVRSDRHMGFGVFRGFESPERALPLYHKVAGNGAFSPHAAEAEFLVGQINEDLRDFEAAIQAYEQVKVRHARTPFAEQAAFRLGLCKASLADDNIRNEPYYRDAMSSLSLFIRDYPNSQKVSEVQARLDNLKDRLAAMYYERAVYYDSVMKRPSAAVIAYSDFIRNFPSSELAQKASERIDVLKAQLETTHEKR